MISPLAANDALRAILLERGPLHAWLHVADPGGYGAAVAPEVAGVPVEFAVPAAGETYNVRALEWVDLPAGSYTHVGVWAGETFVWGVELGEPYEARAGDPLTVPEGGIVLALAG